MSANEFGNYMAGYMGTYHLGDFGNISMRAFGNIFENIKQNKGYSPFEGDDPLSIRDINRGRDDALLEKYEDYVGTFEAVSEAVKGKLVEIFANLGFVYF